MSIFSVSLTISSGTLTPEELSSYAGSEPTDAHGKGDSVSLRLPETNVRPDSYWSKSSGVALDTWTIEPHWRVLAPILEFIASQPANDDLEVTLSIGTNSRSTGFAFDIVPDQMALLTRARCGVWIDSYEANRDHEEMPDDYPYPENGPLHAPGLIRRMRRRLNLELRNINPFGKVRRHRHKLATNTTE